MSRKPTIIYTADQKADLTRQICEVYANGDYTIASCCQSVGVPERTFNQWLHEIPELADAYARAKEEVRRMRMQALKERALTSLEKLVSGYEIKEPMQEGEMDSAGKFVVKKVKIFTKHVQPSFNAVAFALQATDPEQFGGEGPKIPTEPQTFLIGGKMIKF